MKPARRAWMDYLVYCAVRAVAVLFQMFPLEWNLGTARLIGRAWAVLLPRHCRRAEENLLHAYGNTLTPAARRRIAIRCLQHFTMLAVEVIQTPRLMHIWSWRRYIRLVDIAPALRTLLARRGCILVTPHYGSFELLGYTLATLGFPITALMRPFDNEYLNHFLLDRRRRAGLTLLYKKGAMARAPEVLRDGGALCFIADQDAGRKGIFVNFFGRPASTYKSIALLAIEYDVPIVVGCARRVGRGFRYEISANRTILPDEWRARDDAPRWITQEFSSAMERLVRQSPDQYLWFHRRWKTRPRAERRSSPPPAIEPQAAF